MAIKKYLFKFTFYEINQKAIDMQVLRFLIALSLMVFITNNLSARKIENEQFALFDYDVIITEDFLKEIEGLEGTINKIRGYDRKGQEKLKGKVYDIAYFYIEEKLEKTFNIDILPANSYMDNINYNSYAYPDASVRKAQDYGNSKFYFKVTIYIETATPKGKDAQNSILYRNKTSPQVTIEVEVFERIGILSVGKAVGISKTTMPQRVEDDFLKGIVTPLDETEVSDLDETLFALILKAINNMLISFDKNI